MRMLHLTLLQASVCVIYLFKFISSKENNLDKLSWISVLLYILIVVMNEVNCTCTALSLLLSCVLVQPCRRMCLWPLRNTSQEQRKVELHRSGSNQLHRLVTVERATHLAMWSGAYDVCMYKGSNMGIKWLIPINLSVLFSVSLCTVLLHRSATTLNLVVSQPPSHFSHADPFYTTTLKPPGIFNTEADQCVWLTWHLKTISELLLYVIVVGKAAVTDAVGRYGASDEKSSFESNLSQVMWSEREGEGWGQTGRGSKGRWQRIVHSLVFWQNKKRFRVTFCNIYSNSV